MIYSFPSHSLELLLHKDLARFRRAHVTAREGTMTYNVDFSRSFRSAAWALARVCCVGLLFLGATNCLPAASDDTGGSGGGNGGTTGTPTTTPSGGNTSLITTPSGGGTTYTPQTTTPTGGSTYTPPKTTTPTGGSTYTSPTGGVTYTAPTYTTSTGGATYTPPTYTTPTGGTTSTPPVTTTPTPTGGTASSTPTGTTVTFVSGKASGAMVGYGWVAMGSADTVSDPTCGPGKTPITSATPCMTSTTWSSPGSLCISGTVPALGTPPDYTGNWGVSVGVNSDTIVGGGLGQSFSSITIAVSGSPSTGLRAMVHKKGDPDATSYCATLTAGAMPFTSFSTTCYTPASPGVAITAADVSNIDKISVQVSSGTAAITVSSLCITGITFAK